MLLPEPEAADEVVEPLRALAQPDHRGADVRRLGQDLPTPSAHVAALVRLADLAIRHLEDRRQVEARRRGDLLVLDRAGDRERLERRAGLEARLDRLVLQVVRRRARRCRSDRPAASSRARARRRCAGPSRPPSRPSGCSRARPGRAPPRRAPGAAPSIVSCRSSPGRRAVRLDDADRLAERVADDPPLAVGAVQRLLELALDAAQARVLGADDPEQLPGERPLGIGAARLDDGADAGDLELVDLRPDVGVELAARGTRSPCGGPRAASAGRSPACRAAAPAVPPRRPAP